MANRFNCSGSNRKMPLVEGSSAYGASNAAVREPSEPSRMALSVPVFSQGSSVPPCWRISFKRARGSLNGNHSVMRAVNLPSFLSCW